VPPGPTVDPNEAHAAAARVQARRKGVTLGGLTIKELIEAGRQ